MKRKTLLQHLLQHLLGPTGLTGLTILAFYFINIRAETVWAESARSYELESPFSSSAHRPEGTSAKVLIERAFQQQKSLLQSYYRSVLAKKLPVHAVNWSLVPEIPTADLVTSFSAVREERPFRDHEERQRRPTWLYPDDGCFVRAAIADQILREKFNVANSAKIYAFGDLKVQTPNSPQGFVQWWYHVAAIAKVRSPKGEEEVMVYDPALEPTKPLPVKDWLAAMQDPALEVSICSGSSYDPHTACDGSNSSAADAVSRAHRETGSFLSNEWTRISDLGRDPELELLK